MNKKYEVRVNNQLMTRAITCKKAARVTEELKSRGMNASFCSKLNVYYEPSNQVWAFLNKVK